MTSQTEALGFVGVSSARLCLPLLQILNYLVKVLNSVRDQTNVNVFEEGLYLHVLQRRQNE